MGGPSLGSLHISFLGSWVGWVGRCQEAGLPLGSFHVSFFLGPGSDGAAAEKLGSHWAPFILPFWAPGRCFLLSWSWAAAKKLGSIGLPSYFLSGLLGRMGGPRPESWAPVGLPSGFLLSGSWVGWLGRSKEAGLPLHTLHISFSALPGRMGGPRPRSWAPVDLPSCFLLSGLLGRMGGPRPRSWARIGLPSSFLGSRADGRGQELGSLHVSFLGCWVGWVGRGQG